MKFFILCFDPTNWLVTNTWLRRKHICLFPFDLSIYLSKISLACLSNFLFYFTFANFGDCILIFLCSRVPNLWCWCLKAIGSWPKSQTDEDKSPALVNDKPAPGGHGSLEEPHGFACAPFLQTCPCLDHRTTHPKPMILLNRAIYLSLHDDDLAWNFLRSSK